jgi:hypothetical protein
MISPINGDKPVTVSTERSGESAKSNRAEQTAVTPSGTSSSHTTDPVGAIVEVDKARQLYEMENQSARVPGAEIKTPEAARSLLDQIIEQFSKSPEEAMKSQTSGASAPLINLLETAPA